MSPPPTAAQFAEITLDTQSGKIQVDRLLMLVDCGRVINPITAAGQVEGGMSQGLGFALSEEMLFDKDGHQTTTSLSTYHIPRCNEIPPWMLFLCKQMSQPTYGANRYRNRY